jgi:molybdate transport system permease protein
MLFFLALPLLALIAMGGLPQALRELGNDEAREAIALSVKTTLTAAFVIVVLGTPLAYWVGRAKGTGRRVVETLVELPIALPPAAAGVALLVAFGRNGFINLGVSFTTTAVIMAQVFVAAPFYMRAAIAAFGQLPDELFDDAQASGASQVRLFTRVAVPLARRALIGGLVVAWARAAGEFGATIIFAGNFPGRTQTMPLAIYLGFEVDLREALALSVVLMAVAAIGLGFAHWLTRDPA